MIGIVHLIHVDSEIFRATERQERLDAVENGCLAFSASVEFEQFLTIDNSGQAQELNLKVVSSYSATLESSAALEQVDNLIHHPVGLWHRQHHPNVNHPFDLVIRQPDTERFGFGF